MKSATAKPFSESPLSRRARELREGKAKAAPPALAPAETLKAAQASLEKHSAAIKRHIESFDKVTLANKLGLGLAALKAYMVFAATDPAKRGQGRKGKNQLTRELIPEGGFKGWLLSIGTQLKEPVSYKYMTAVRGLGLDHQATDRDIARELKRREKAGEDVTLVSLMAAAVQRIGPPEETPPPSEQQEFAFMKERLKSYREETEHLLSIKDQLRANPDLFKAACARAYAALAELTGTQWAPSDEADELASIDPDSITL